ncbi:hypothetical protein M6B38_339835 [Iris pallida]|uniref:Uncharacterized protein n=1 Tax=Iris pallida TaxID=29817 RepID=A0AAX6GYM7_IRIPA|nr:hypothetical protein M6B38_339835 [Iris pallida]
MSGGWHSTEALEKNRCSVGDVVDLAARVAVRARPSGGGGDHWPGNQSWRWLAPTREVGEEWAYV